MINRTPARDRPGAAGWRRGSQYRGSRVMPVEGKDLSSRQTQDVARGLGDWVTYQLRTASRSCRRRCTRKLRLNPATASMPCTTRSAAPTSWPTPTPYAAPTRGQREWTVRTSPRLRRWARALAGRTGACSQRGDLPTGPHQTRVYREGQRQTGAAGHLDLARSGLHDSGDAGAGSDLRCARKAGEFQP